MIDSPQTGTPSGSDPEATLRLLAKMPAPDGLADRVHRRMAHAQAEPQRKFWRGWMPTRPLQLAAAGLIVVATAASTWSFYQGHHRVPDAARTTPAVVAPTTTDASGFLTSGAERHPASLKPIKVPPPAKKKAGAAKSHSSKPSASQLPN